MALELIIDSTEGLADGVADLYKEVDGKFHLEVNGIPDVNGLTNTLAKQKTTIKTGKESITTLKDRVNELESAEVARLEAAGESEKADSLKYDKYKTATDAKLADYASMVNAMQGKSLENIFREVASKAGVHKSAVNDVLLHGKSMFTLDAKGDAVQLDSDGSPVLGANGTDNFSPSEWMTGMKETSPHWFPADSSGGGSTGGSTGGATGGDKSPVDMIRSGLASR